ncbi:malectin domain-containing carbohydrate-binding protein [Telmatobacter bradus]|uniref:malectin domain-containing carbohydrate-binding protein n=1 Tax=Telmatobacter bradus TaxID=474953 RepID=UPI003B43AB35
MIAVSSPASGRAQEALPGADTVLVPDAGWNLWPDVHAEWKDDVLYLPEEVNLAKLPVHPPTGGWQVLDQQGIRVTLPATVEQYYWGKLGQRPYTASEYGYTETDPEIKNGNYEGVSWWTRSVDIPAGFAHKLVLLHLRGARQRAEIFVNHKLVGYDLIAETAFDVDISKAIEPGKPNQIVIRITNPGGRLDWRDQNMHWGKYELQKSPGFGGLDRGMTITAHDAVFVEDAWVLNRPEPHTIQASATIRNTTAAAEQGTLRLSVVDLKTGAVRVSREVAAHVAAGSSADFSATLIDATAQLWDLDTPQLYGLKADWIAAGDSDERTIRFGYRWFEPRGIGSDAGLYLNGRRVRLLTSISWGFWGLNGLWPTPELTKKEVSVAKDLGLNMLNFHRNIGKEDVLDRQDEMGLLRYMEPGGGRNLLGPSLGREDKSKTGPFDVSGKGGDPDSFLARYTADKTLRMVKMFRSHPSLVIWVVQNETEPDVSNAHVWNTLRAMHALDPSRVVAAKSGISPLHQAWLAPWSDVARYDDGTGYSGWRDQHTVGGPGVWTDDLYKDPEHYTHKLDDAKEIVDWGEMLGVASADHHGLMVKQIEQRGGASYDLADHQAIDAAYQKYLAQTGLDKSYPTTESLYDGTGRKEYEFWGRVIESARLSDSNDILSISGWESTTIENHSGLVDNMRNPRTDPALLSKHLAPLLPVVRPRGVVHAAGDEVLVDVYLLNETGKPHDGTLTLTMTAPDGQQSKLGEWTAPAYRENHFVYPVQMAVKTPALAAEGIYTLHLALQGATPAENSETVQVIAQEPSSLKVAQVGVVGDVALIAKELEPVKNLRVEAFDPARHYDVIVAAQKANGTIVHINDGSRIANTEDDALYYNSIRGGAGAFTLRFTGLPAGAAKVSLYFADAADAKPGSRTFDILINKQTVVKAFDIAAEAHGGATAVVKSFEVNAPEGVVEITPGAVTGVSMSYRAALFNAVKIEAGGKSFAYALGGETYTDHHRLVWNSYLPPSNLTAEVLDVVKAGTPLILTAPDASSATPALKLLDATGALKFHGVVPSARASWMGDWVFTGPSDLFAGLGKNEVAHGDYQLNVNNSYGVQVDGPGVQVVAGYGRDHGQTLGAAAFTASLGKGTVLFDGLVGSPVPVVKTRLLTNAINLLLAEEK